VLLSIIREKEEHHDSKKEEKGKVLAKQAKMNVLNL
jgi:hypothetical protein